MSGFGHFARDALELEREILKRGIALKIDWDDKPALQRYAHEALTCSPDCNWDKLHAKDPRERMLAELYALSNLMLQTMRESAEQGEHTHGGPVWKAFGRALIEEADRLGLSEVALNERNRRQTSV